MCFYFIEYTYKVNKNFEVISFKTTKKDKKSNNWTKCANNYS